MSVVAVVYVHGLWLGGQESIMLRRRLATALKAGTHAFSYPSMSSNVTDNALALRRFLVTIPAGTLHLVAHSLGGLVVLRMFELGVQLPPGRIVLLGSPVQGSRSAERLVRLPFGRRLLGRTAGETLLGSPARLWNGARDLGVIAGDMPVGIGRLLGPMRARNDGTVLVEETVLPGARQSLVMKVSHSRMPFSAVVARQIAGFLQDGRFH
jgi:hypothetical protein